MRAIRLSVKLPLFVVLAVVLTAGMGSLMAIIIGRDVLRETELEENVNSVQTYASAIGFYLDNARSVLEITVHLPEVKDFTSARFINPALHGVPHDKDAPKHALAARILEHSKVFEYIMLLKADGSVYLLEPHDLQVKLSHHNLSFTAWYKKLMRTGKTVVSDLHISSATQRPTVIIATPVQDSAGKITGIWVGALRLEELSQIGHGGLETGTPQRYGYVADSRGLIIAHQAKPKYVEEQTDFSSVAPVRSALAGQQGVAQFFDPIERDEKLGAYVTIPDTGWAVVYIVPTHIAFAPMNDLARNIALIAAALAAFLGLIGVVIMRQIVRPLGELTLAAGSIGAGDFTPRIEVKTGDEVEQLADAFNRMSAALSDKEAQLRQRAEQLEAANKELEAFSYSVSHDLRAPLRAIDGFSRVILEDYTDKFDGEGKRVLNIIRDSTQKMGLLIDDLLAFSRLGRQEMRFWEINMDKLANAVFEELKSTAQERKLQLNLKTLPTAYGDRAMIRQIFVNLFSNAVKFTRPKKTAIIEVGGRVEGDENIYYVKDNGVGFDMQYVNKLFGVFQRLHSASEFEGTGVGLAIVQRIIHRHGGRVWAEGKVDEGAAFYFTLPTREEGTK
jgi:signal transduction histidine kinase